MKKELEEFSSLVQLTPSISILDLNNNFSDLTVCLNNLVASCQGKISTIESSPVNNLRAKIKRSNYDYAVISDIILNSEDKNSMMKIISNGLRDAGYIVILEPKEKPLYDIYNLLEEFDYGAVSSIDIFDDYSLIIGKKLHMWGNGL